MRYATKRIELTVSPVTLPSLQSRVHSVHTTLQTPRKKMANAIILPLPTHAQEKVWDLFGNIRYLFDYMPLPPVEPAEP